MKSKKQLK